MRRLALPILAAAFAGAATAGPVDLDAPGALDALRTQQPDHYRKVVAILEAVEKRPDVEALGRWIETTFDARDVASLRYWRVSDPPVLDVAFTLDGTRYKARVTSDVPPLQALR